ASGERIADDLLLQWPKLIVAEMPLKACDQIHTGRCKSGDGPLPRTVSLCALAKQCRTWDRTKTRPTTIMRVVLVVISVLASMLLQPKSAVGAQDSNFTVGVFGRELPADAPANYRKDYILTPSSISPYE